MFRMLIAFWAFVACVNGKVLRPPVPMPDGRIVGGEDTTINSHPWQVSIRLFDSHSCGGSIINERTIVTAAHCGGYPAGWYKIQYGVTTIGGTTNIASVKSFIRHPQYDSSVMDYDVAVIILDEPISFEDIVQPIKLADSRPADGDTAVCTGWGALREGGSSPMALQAVKVEIVNIDDCKKNYSEGYAISDRMICAGVKEGGKDACSGDSGGPLVTGNVLSGIVSWGVGCARPNYPGVYTNVANLKSWIEENAVL
ncbi:vitellin-degrading protease-like [Teleopsis dalmanni]|uniref:vitellin-degrading protease-like n=1 Tax=Teleopsis dalmanni TaxID=139649 RepID=UPI0018CF31F5|nr:vitellin-degrading protease-like [Teleopsis dalmanni]